ncbi:hypothetical protein EIP91_002098 [Steccherinum ochraceum]|uniref:Uncharacterized protein n=1 Tax=Steccherinum ochraceum TaxID=92696 RepID=A0A4R0RU33_9APHY|nr:hypothetical protein EIP91_002098 [Steccherinum ochraceum]
MAGRRRPTLFSRVSREPEIFEPDGFSVLSPQRVPIVVQTMISDLNGAVECSTGKVYKYESQKHDRSLQHYYSFTDSGSPTILLIHDQHLSPSLPPTSHTFAAAMRFATILGALLAVSASSSLAVPLHAPGDIEAATMKARALIARDVLQAIHARELAALDARSQATTTPLLAKRKEDPYPVRVAYRKPGRYYQADRQSTDPARAADRRINQANNDIANRPILPPTGQRTQGNGGQGTRGGQTGGR